MSLLLRLWVELMLIVPVRRLVANSLEVQGAVNGKGARICCGEGRGLDLRLSKVKERGWSGKILAEC